MEVKSQLRAPAALPPGKEHPGTDEIGGWMGPRATFETWTSLLSLSNPFFTDSLLHFGVWHWNYMNKNEKFLFLPQSVHLVAGHKLYM